LLLLFDKYSIRYYFFIFLDNRILLFHRFAVSVTFVAAAFGFLDLFNKLKLQPLFDLLLL